MKPEERIVLLLSRINPSRDAMNEAENILKDRVRPVGLGGGLDIAASNGVSPLLYHNLKEKALVPEDSLERLRGSFLQAVNDNIRRGREVLRITELLKAKDIDSIVLKGPVASEIIFGNPGLYLSSDIDILVRPSDLERAGAALSEAGYRMESGVCEEDMMRGTYHLAFYDHYVVEIHWTLAFRYFDIPAEFWHEEAESVEYEGAQLKVLSPDRYILYTIFRLYNKAFEPLKYFVLPAEIVNKYGGEIDWRRLLAFSEKYRMKRLVVFTLKILHELLGANVPGEIVSTKICGYGFLKSLVLSGLFGVKTRIHARMLLYTTLQDSLFDMLRILSARAFPGKSEIRLRYRLAEDSKKVYLYYILNPFLLLLERYKRE